jgi:hypothetical protein
MTAHALLDALRARGIELYVADGRLRYRCPAGALDAPLRRAAAEHRAQILALLGSPPLGPSAWDEEAAKAELCQALAVIDRALLATWLRPAHCNLLSIFRIQGSGYHARHDPHLFGFLAWVEAHVGRWKAEHNSGGRNRVEGSTPITAENAADGERCNLNGW